MLKKLNIEYDSKQHISAFDGLRGLAVLLVLIYHCVPTLYKVGTGIGWIGVDLFFVLSGFLITGILLDKKTSPNYFTSFFAKRVLRIFPLYYLILLIFFVLLPKVSNTNFLTEFSFYFKNQAWYWLYVPNFLIVSLDSWPPVPLPVLDHFWSLAIEEQFYLFWPFLVYFFKPKHMVYICLFFISTSLILRNVFENIGMSYASSYVFTFTRLDAICMGSLIALLIRDSNKRLLLEKVSPYALTFSIVAIGIVIVISRSISLKDPHFVRFGYTFVASMFGAVLVHALDANHWIKNFAESQWLRWLGTYSYGIYVYHWFFYPFMASYLSIRFENIGNSFSQGLLISAISIASILIISYLSWHLIENKFIKLKQYV